jgi:hypothetical protein
VKNFFFKSFFLLTLVGWIWIRIPNAGTVLSYWHLIKPYRILLLIIDLPTVPIYFRMYMLLHFPNSNWFRTRLLHTGMVIIKFVMRRFPGMSLQSTTKIKVINILCSWIQTALYSQFRSGFRKATNTPK